MSAQLPKIAYQMQEYKEKACSFELSTNFTTNVPLKEKHSHSFYVVLREKCSYLNNQSRRLIEMIKFNDFYYLTLNVIPYDNKKGINGLVVTARDCVARLQQALFHHLR